MKTRFPGLADGWSRFDGPAGTQVVDAAIAATAQWQRSGNNANSHGAFAAAQACDALMDSARATMRRLLGGIEEGWMFGPSTTNNVMHLTRAIAHGLGPGDEIICTTLDHDSNVAPWLLAAADSGATVRMAQFDLTTGRLATEAVTELLTERTRWVAVSGASNAIGTMPDIKAITAAGHAVGARIAVDGVHLTPHRAVNIDDIGCDVYSTSSYKWYGPHAGMTWVEPGLLDSLHVYKVRPAPDVGGEQLQLGTPAYEGIAGIIAAAEFLLDEGMGNIAQHESTVFARLLDGLLALDHVSVLGPRDLVERVPTVAFNVAGAAPHSVAEALAAANIAVWDGHYYAVELMRSYGLADGAVRAGVACYIDDEDVDRLLDVVDGFSPESECQGDCVGAL